MSCKEKKCDAPRENNCYNNRCTAHCRSHAKKRACRAEHGGTPRPCMDSKCDGNAVKDCTRLKCDKHCNEDASTARGMMAPKCPAAHAGAPANALGEAEAGFSNLQNKMSAGGTRPMVQLRYFYTEGKGGTERPTAGAGEHPKRSHMEGRAAQNTEVQSWIWKMYEVDESFKVMSVSTYSHSYGVAPEHGPKTIADIVVTTVTFRSSTFRGNELLFRAGNRRANQSAVARVLPRAKKNESVGT
jgi:hypothetical protein